MTINIPNLVAEVPSSIYSNSQLALVKKNIASKADQTIEQLKASLQQGVGQSVANVQSPVATPIPANTPSIPSKDDVKKFLPNPTEMIVAKLPYFAQGLANIDALKSFTEKISNEANEAANQIKKLQDLEDAANDKADEVYTRSTGLTV